MHCFSRGVTPVFLRDSYRGFTLLELLVVLAITSILAALAYPSYTAVVLETHRKAAVGEVLDVAAGLERVKSQRFSYPDQSEFLRSVNERYDIHLVSDPTTYTISAIPVGSQDDDECGTLSYNNESLWTVSTGASESDCIQH